MTIDDYEWKTTTDITADAVEALSPIEQNFCKLFVRIELKGKRDRTVPVLLPGVQTHVDLLLRTVQQLEFSPVSEWVSV